MRCQVPQISWHGRDPVLSIDFQPIGSDLFRLASGGTDSHVLIWYITYQENKSIKVECASDLYRHNKSVNVVRFSPNGEFLASGDDEGAIFIWELKERELTIDQPNEDEVMNKEEWYPVKLLRGHLDDIYDISWSKDGNFLVSASMDNTAIVWDMQKYVKTHIFSDFKGYVQGVTWDPCSQYIASVGSDRSLRIHNINSRKIVYKVTKAPWKNSTEKGTFQARLFYDDTLQSYFRRLTFTPDGEFLIVPSGILEKGETIENTCYIFSRYALNKPVISLPTGDKYTVAVKCNPLLYKLRGKHDISVKENESPKPMMNLPYRMIFAVAASDSVLMYDTEQLLPFSYISNIHYTHLTDLSWSSDGLTLVVSSTDGYCSFILFTREELGDIYIPEKQDTEKKSEQTAEVCKSEKVVINQSSDISSALNVEKDKDPNAPISPKSSSFVSAKSPKSSSNNSKDESSTPSSKAKIMAEIKKSNKKSPKLCSIKKFLVSPKNLASTSVSSEDKRTVEKTCVKDKTAVVSETSVETITLSDSPMKGKSNVKISDNTFGETDIKQKNFKSVAIANTKAEAMDVDHDHNKSSAGKIESSEISIGFGKQPKCKVHLDFVDEAMADIDDNASDIDHKAKSNEIKSNIVENDWKLELSQDEEIVPMEVTPTVADAKPEVSKSLDLKDAFKTATVTNSGARTGTLKPSQSKQTPKRRVNFVTLSSKASFKK